MQYHKAVIVAEHYCDRLRWALQAVRKGGVKCRGPDWPASKSSAKDAEDAVLAGNNEIVGIYETAELKSAG
jgi:hypothetical protein